MKVVVVVSVEHFFKFLFVKLFGCDFFVAYLSEKFKVSSEFFHCVFVCI